MNAIKLYIIILFFLCFASGFTSFYIFILLYNKYKLNKIRSYLYLLSTISYIVIIMAVNFYYKSIFLLKSNIIYDFFFFNSLLIGLCMYIYTLPAFIYTLIRYFIIKKNILLLNLYCQFFIYIFKYIKSNL